MTLEMSTTDVTWPDFFFQKISDPSFLSLFLIFFNEWQKSDGHETHNTVGMSVMRDKDNSIHIYLWDKYY